MPRSTDAPGILILPPVLVGGTMIIGFLLDWVWPMPLLPAVPARAGGIALFLLGGVLAHFAQNAMTRAGTNIFPTQPAVVLVTEGPFRFTRNPLYIAAVGVYLGVALWLNGLAPFLLLAPMLLLLHWGIVLREERYLETKFGEAYRVYCAQVPRWL